MSTRFKRLSAFFIDWNLTLFPLVFIFALLTTFFHTGKETDTVLALLLVLLVIFFFALFVLRDLIFKGRSLGKRILGLYVYSESTREPATASQLFLRQLFLFLLMIDAITLLVTGRTIGARVAGTSVISKKDIEAYKSRIQYDLLIPRHKRTQKTLLIIAIVIGCLILFTGMIQIILNVQKNTEEYKIAYSYFIESESFKSLNTDESRIRFNQYNLSTYSTHGTVYKTARIGFIASSETFEVVCHQNNGIWTVCDECTAFE